MTRLYFVHLPREPRPERFEISILDPPRLPVLWSDSTVHNGVHISNALFVPLRYEQLHHVHKYHGMPIKRVFQFEPAESRRCTVAALNTFAIGGRRSPFTRLEQVEEPLYIPQLIGASCKKALEENPQNVYSYHLRKSVSAYRRVDAASPGRSRACNPLDVFPEKDGVPVGRIPELSFQRRRQRFDGRPMRSKESNGARDAVFGVLPVLHNGAIRFTLPPQGSG